MTETSVAALTVGDAAPGFTGSGMTLAANGGASVALSSCLGQPVVLYFYPKDLTSGCTKEAEAFRDAYADFQAAGVTVLGVSKDPVKKHDQFVAKHDLPFPLLADEDGALCEAYGVWVEKSMYGRKYMGIERATFLVAADGTLAQIWRKVKVTGHVEAVLKAALALTS